MLDLQVGKIYKNGKGEIVTIVATDCSLNSTVFWIGDNGTYYFEGGHYINKKITMFDLVAEVVELPDSFRGFEEWVKYAHACEAVNNGFRKTWCKHCNKDMVWE